MYKCLAPNKNELWYLHTIIGNEAINRKVSSRIKGILDKFSPALLFALFHSCWFPTKTRNMCYIPAASFLHLRVIYTERRQKRILSLSLLDGKKELRYTGSYLSKLSDVDIKCDYLRTHLRAMSLSLSHQYKRILKLPPGDLNRYIKYSYLCLIVNGHFHFWYIWNRSRKHFQFYKEHSLSSNQQLKSLATATKILNLRNPAWLSKLSWNCIFTSLLQNLKRDYFNGCIIVSLPNVINIIYYSYFWKLELYLGQYRCSV